MSLQTVSAIYEGGVFKPLQQIKLNDHQRLRLIIETEREAFSN
jgi:predicted DNA-binding antitoxin AbrB/MazE fold protein